MEIPEEKQVKIVAYKLRGGASVWWDQIQFSRRREGKQVVRTWNKMKQLLRKMYLPPDYQQYMDCNQRYKTVTEYVNEFYRLGARLNLADTEIQKVSRFMSGLKDSIRDELTMNTIWTMNEAINYAKKS